MLLLGVIPWLDGVGIMMTKDDLVSKDTALKMAIEALLYGTDHTKAVKACKEALEQPTEPRLVSSAPDGSTCTLNIDGEEVYFNREQPTVAELNDEYLRDTNVMGLEQPAQIGCVQHDCPECKKASEPVAWLDEIQSITEQEYYPTPVWVGLSDSELEDLKYEYNHGGNGYSMEDIINIACSWLKEKNTNHINKE